MEQKIQVALPLRAQILVRAHDSLHSPTFTRFRNSISFSFFREQIIKTYRHFSFKDFDMDSQPASLIGGSVNGTASELEDLKATEAVDIPFGNGEWLPVIPEPEENVYWNSFPWRFKRGANLEITYSAPYPFAVWKLVAGTTVTHLSEGCIKHMTTHLSKKFLMSYRLAPQVIDLGVKYESVLGYFTERMLGINDYIPMEKRGLLNNLFDETGYKRGYEIIERFGTVVPDKFPL